MEHIEVEKWFNIHSKNSRELEESLITGEIENENGEFVPISNKQRKTIIKELRKRNNKIGDIYFYDSGQDGDYSRPWIVEENNLGKYKIRKSYGSNKYKNSNKRNKDKKAFYWLYKDKEKSKGYIEKEKNLLMIA